jgi:hypothetical protein
MKAVLSGTAFFIPRDEERVTVEAVTLFSRLGSACRLSSAQNGQSLSCLALRFVGMVIWHDQRNVTEQGLASTKQGFRLRRPSCQGAARM